MQDPILGELSRCCVFRDGKASANAQFLEVDATTTVLLCPLDCDFQLQFLAPKLQLNSDSLSYCGEQHPFRMDTDSAVRLVLIRLGSGWEVLVQLRVQSDWVCAFETGLLELGVDALFLELHGRGAVFVGTEPPFLSAYPQLDIAACGAAWVSQLEPEAALMAVELVGTPFVPGSSLFRMPRKQLEQLVQQRVGAVQEALTSGSILRLCRAASAVPSSTGFRPGFPSVLKAAVMSSRARLSLSQAEQKQTEKVLRDFEATHLPPGQSYARFRADLISCACPLCARDRRGDESMDGFDCLENALWIPDHPQLHAFCQEQSTRKGVSGAHLFALKKAFSCDRGLAAAWLKLLLHFNPAPFIKLLKGDFLDRQTDLAFLCQTFREFPAQFQAQIASLVFKHRDDVVFDICPDFVAANPLFKFVKGQAARRFTYASLVHPGLVLARMKLADDSSFLERDDFVCRADVLQELGLEEVQELRFPQDEEQNETAETEFCPVCLGAFEDRIVFNCSHAICGVCFRSGEWERCPACRAEISRITYGAYSLAVL